MLPASLLQYIHGCYLWSLLNDSFCNECLLVEGNCFNISDG